MTLSSMPRNVMLTFDFVYIQLDNLMRVLTVHAVDPELVQQIFRQVRLIKKHFLNDTADARTSDGRGDGILIISFNFSLFIPCFCMI